MCSSRRATTTRGVPPSRLVKPLSMPLPLLFPPADVTALTENDQLAFVQTVTGRSDRQGFATDPTSLPYKHRKTRQKTPQKPPESGSTPPFAETSLAEVPGSDRCSWVKERTGDKIRGGFGTNTPCFFIPELLTDPFERFEYPSGLEHGNATHHHPRPDAPPAGGHRLSSL